MILLLVFLVYLKAIECEPLRITKCFSNADSKDHIVILEYCNDEGYKYSRYLILDTNRITDNIRLAEDPETKKPMCFFEWSRAKKEGE